MANPTDWSTGLQALGLGGEGSFSFMGMGFVPFLLLTIILLIVGVVVVGGGIVGLIWWKSYTERVRLWKDYNGTPVLIKTYRAKWKKLNEAGDRLMYIMVASRWEFPTISSAPHVYDFHQGTDGEWRNCKIESFDKKLGELKVNFTAPDMRSQRIAIQKGLEKRLQKNIDWLAILANIGYVLFIVMTLISLIILFMQLKDVAEALDNVSGSVGEMANTVARYYNHSIGGIQPTTGNTGLIPA